VRTIYPGNFFAEMPEFAAASRSHVIRTARVRFWPEPELLFYAQRVSATRYIFLFPLSGPTGTRAKNKSPRDEIQRAAPAAAVFVPNDLFFKPGSDQYFTDWSCPTCSKIFIRTLG